MILLHTSDSHFDASKRLDDVIEGHRRILQVAREKQVDLIVHGGDFFERRSTAAERSALAEWLQAATEIAPFYGVRGNHDVPGDLEIMNRLETRHPLRIEERVTSEPGSAWRLPLASGESVGLLGMAWVDKAHLVAGLGAAVDAEQSRQLTIEAVRTLLRCLAAEAASLRGEGCTPVLVSHGMMGGGIASSGQPLIGHGIELSPSDLADVGAAYCALGHLHLHQEFLDGSVAYSGNVTRHDAGEARDPKGIRLVTLQDGRFAGVEFVELPARRIVLLEKDWTGQAESDWIACDEVTELALPGALVRFRYQVRAEDLHRVNEDQIRERLLAAGAAEVKLEAVIVQEARVRSERIVEARGVFEKVCAWADAKGMDLSPEVLERLREKCAAIEARCATGSEVAA